MLINCIFSVNDVIYPDTRTQREYGNVDTVLAASLAKESSLRSFIQSFMPRIFTRLSLYYAVKSARIVSCATLYAR